MRLLLDQNLSWRLIPQLESDFADSSHVRSFELDRASDAEVWRFAREAGYVVLTKDSDFDDDARFPGPPPKVVHLLIGNASTSAIAEVLLRHRETIAAFETSIERALELLPD